jgi:hypothetical protein
MKWPILGADARVGLDAILDRDSADSRWET